MAGKTSPAVSPLEICPLEVWSKIFDKLDCPTDVASCYRTCRDWMSFLEPKRAHFLMPEVFPLIVKYLTTTKEKEEDEDVDASADSSDVDEDASNYDSDWEDFDDDDDSVDGSVENETLIPNPILSTRLVCKSWKYAVDIFLQNHPYHTNVDILQEEENPDPSEEIRALSIKHYEFNITNIDDLKNLVKKDFPSDRNPFLTRYLKYSELNADVMNGGGANLRRLRRAFTKLLELQGTQVWHVSFRMTFPWFGSAGMKTKFYNLVHRYLNLMPNLKTLDIFFDTPCTSSYLRHMTPSHEQLLVTAPLSTLEKLVALKLRNVPAPLEKGILLTNNQVQKLLWWNESFLGSTCTLANLQMGMLEEFTTDVNFETDILTLQSLSWPFKKLSIRSEHVFLDSAIRAISASHFANNLKHLIVDVVGDEGVHKLKEKLELPNLITFQIRVNCLPLKSIDFLLPTSTSLSSLQIVMNAEHEPTRSMTTRSMKKEMRISSSDQAVQFYDYVPNMLESNIWKHFPKLKRLEIAEYAWNHVRDWSFSCCGGRPDNNHFKNEKYEYTREDWQNFVKNQLK